MRPLLAVLAVALAAAEPDDPGLAVAVQEVSYSQRVEFVQGNGRHPFADEDQRRAQVALQVRAAARVALLGWDGLTVEAVDDAGASLALAMAQPAGVFTGQRDLRDAPGAQIPGVGLPLTRQAVSGLARIAGTVEIRFSRAEPEPERLPFASFAEAAEVAVPGVAEGAIALADRGDNRVVFRLSPAAFLAVADLAFADGDGKDLPARNRRAEWRDGRGQLTYSLRTERIAAVILQVHRRIEARRVAFATQDLGLGLALPGREDLRGPVERGAGEF